MSCRQSLQSAISAGIMALLFEDEILSRMENFLKPRGEEEEWCKEVIRASGGGDERRVLRKFCRDNRSPSASITTPWLLLDTEPLMLSSLARR